MLLPFLQAMTSDQIVEASNHEYHRRVSNMWDGSKPADDPADVPGNGERTRCGSECLLTGSPLYFAHRDRQKHPRVCTVDLGIASPRLSVGGTLLPLRARL
jgi:hypothetical protein